MEKFDVYNEKGEPTGKTATRGIALKEDEYFPVVHIWLQDEKGQFLIQQRAKTTDLIPYQWATTTGLVLAGETPLESALREIKEELGLIFQPAALRLIKKIITREGKYQTVTYVFLGKANIDEKAIQINHEEVLKTDKVSLQTIKEMIQKKTFWNYSKLLRYNEYFSLLEGKI